MTAAITTPRLLLRSDRGSSDNFTAEDNEFPVPYHQPARRRRHRLVLCNQGTSPCAVSHPLINSRSGTTSDSSHRVLEEHSAGTEMGPGTFPRYPGLRQAEIGSVSSDRMHNMYSDDHSNTISSFEDKLVVEMDDEDNCWSFPRCRTEAVVEQLSFQWDVSGFLDLRKMAKLKGLPFRDRLLSPKFMSKRGGTWHLALFPYTERDGQRSISVYLFCDDASKPRVAEFRICLLDEHSKPLPGTELQEETTLFSRDNPSWGWHQFLLIESEQALLPYLIKQSTLSIRVSVQVFCGVQEFTAPLPLFNIFTAVLCNQTSPGPVDSDMNKTGSIVEKIVAENKSEIHKIETQTLAAKVDSFKLNPLKISAVSCGPKRNENNVHSYEQEMSSKEQASFNRPQNTHIPYSPNQIENNKTFVRRLRESIETVHVPRSELYATHDEPDEPDDPPILISLKPTTVMDDMVSLFQNHDELRDIDILCADGLRLRSSRLLLAARSPVLHATLFGCFGSPPKELSMIHASADAAKEFILFLETGHCSAIKTQPGKTYTLDFSMLVLELLELADSYLVPALYISCIKLLTRSLHYSTAASVLAVARRLHCNPLIVAAKKFLMLQGKNSNTF